MSNTDKYVLAVDLGTSGCKTALVSLRGEVTGWEFEPVPTQLFPNGGAEQDPDSWWSAFTLTAKRLLKRAAVPPDLIAAVCCSTQGEGTVAVDAGGQALRPCILWMDTRGAEHLKKLTRGLLNVAGYHPAKIVVNGTPMDLVYQNNPYRPGGASIPCPTLLALLAKGENRIEIFL